MSPSTRIGAGGLGDSRVSVVRAYHDGRRAMVDGVEGADSPPPPLPLDVAGHLWTGLTDPEREPAFGADFDDQWANGPEEAVRLRELLRG